MAAVCQRVPFLPSSRHAVGDKSNSGFGAAVIGPSCPLTGSERSAAKLKREVPAGPRSVQLPAAPLDFGPALRSRQPLRYAAEAGRRGKGAGSRAACVCAEAAGLVGRSGPSSGGLQTGRAALCRSGARGGSGAETALLTGRALLGRLSLRGKALAASQGGSTEPSAGSCSLATISPCSATGLGLSGWMTVKRKGTWGCWLMLG